ncbi:MAG TPA: hypothetical protein VI454_06880 [Verrucomicrobiae bacterium]|jgi:hypothetical protein
MPHRRQSPEEFAELFAETIRDAAPHFATFKRELNLDAPEYARLLFTSLLFPLSASHSIAVAQPGTPLAAIIPKAHDVFLSKLRNPDQLVTLGDYVIWRIERDAISKVLYERFSQSVDAARFASHQIGYGLMAHIVSDVRKRTFLMDAEYGSGMASSGQPKDRLMGALMWVATSFTRYVLTIDPTNPQNTQATVDRYRTSIAFACQIVGDIYFRLVQECKAAHT